MGDNYWQEPERQKGVAPEAAASDHDPTQKTPEQEIRERIGARLKDEMPNVKVTVQGDSIGVNPINEIWNYGFGAKEAGSNGYASLEQEVVVGSQAVDRVGRLLQMATALPEDQRLLTPTELLTSDDRTTPRAVVDANFLFRRHIYQERGSAYTSDQNLAAKGYPETVAYAVIAGVVEGYRTAVEGECKNQAKEMEGKEFAKWEMQFKQREGVIKRDIQSKTQTLQQSEVELNSLGEPYLHARYDHENNAAIVTRVKQGLSITVDSASISDKLPKITKSKGLLGSNFGQKTIIPNRTEFDTLDTFVSSQLQASQEASTDIVALGPDLNATGAFKNIKTQFENGIKGWLTRENHETLKGDLYGIIGDMNELAAKYGIQFDTDQLNLMYGLANDKRISDESVQYIVAYTASLSAIISLIEPPQSTEGLALPDLRNLKSVKDSALDSYLWSGEKASTSQQRFASLRNQYEPLNSLAEQLRVEIRNLEDDSTNLQQELAQKERLRQARIDELFSNFILPYMQPQNPNWGRVEYVSNNPVERAKAFAVTGIAQELVKATVMAMPHAISDFKMEGHAVRQELDRLSWQNQSSLSVASRELLRDPLRFPDFGRRIIESILPKNSQSPDVASEVIFRILASRSDNGSVRQNAGLPNNYNTPLRYRTEEGNALITAALNGAKIARSKVDIRIDPRASDDVLRGFYNSVADDTFVQFGSGYSVVYIPGAAITNSRAGSAYNAGGFSECVWSDELINSTGRFLQNLPKGPQYRENFDFLAQAGFSNIHIGDSREPVYIINAKDFQGVVQQHPGYY